ncbi:MAG: response regulator, partial [Archangium sp.]|nr:response regulator [Archangium sp.]
MPKSVLVADDSLTIRKVVGMLFATEDLTLTAVDNGIDAVARARELRPDLVLADCMMPGKNGYDVCSELKNDPNTAHIPVLLLAGTFEPFDPARAQACGANGHIPKPFDSASFLDRVKVSVGLPAGGAPVGIGAPMTAASVPQPAAPVAQPMQTRPAQPMGQPMGGIGQPRPMAGPQGMPGQPLRPSPGIPMGTQPGMPPRPGMPGGIPMGTQPGMPPRPMGVPGMPGTMPPGPGMARPMPGAPGMPPAPG